MVSYIAGEVRDVGGRCLKGWLLSPNEAEKLIKGKITLRAL